MSLQQRLNQLSYFFQRKYRFALLALWTYAALC